MIVIVGVEEAVTTLCRCQDEEEIKNHPQRNSSPDVCFVLYVLSFISFLSFLVCLFVCLFVSIVFCFVLFGFIRCQDEEEILKGAARKMSQKIGAAERDRSGILEETCSPLFLAHRQITDPQIHRSSPIGIRALFIEWKRVNP